MTVERLLARCAALAYGDRVRLMIDLGRQSVSDPVVAATLAALADGDVYQRMLALQACYGSGDSAPALAAVNDPSGPVRHLAMAVIRAIGS
jgi:hypothetical protein